jgi:NOL1/NOP2/sun family putative RNA methylase
MSRQNQERREKQQAYQKQHPNDLQVKGEQYEEIADAPQHRETGEFFLKRYRAIEPSVKAVDPKSVQQALRVNTLRTTADELTQSFNKRGAFLQKIPFLRHGYYAKASFSLGATPEYLLGYYYLQSPLSQLACEALDPIPGSVVLDMAAAPGGKTTYLAAMVGPKGRVVALDNDAMRLASVRNNVERLGLLNVVCVRKDARFATDLKTQFPYILLDAPCSGNFCSEENWFGKRRIDDIKNNSRTQKELFRAAYACLAPGGRMVYSTCSLEPEEDELIIDWALKKYPDLAVVPLNITVENSEGAATPIGDPGATQWDGQQLDPRLAGVRRFWPHKTSMEGFFIAVLEKAR